MVGTQWTVENEQTECQILQPRLLPVLRVPWLSQKTITGDTPLQIFTQEENVLWTETKFAQKKA